MDSMDGPLVSVIVAVSNGSRYLAQALESVLSQTYRRIDLIVVDDGSVDNSDRIARSREEIRYISQQNAGLAVARNVGVNAAQGELVAFIDQDDLWTPNKLDSQVDYLLQNPEIQYVNAWVKMFVEPGTSPRQGYTEDFLGRAHVGRTPGTLVARKSVFDLIGMFSADFSIACDVEWFVRANARNIPMFIIPEVLLYKRIHNNNLSSDVKTNRKELFSVIRRSVGRRRHHKTGDLSDP